MPTCARASDEIPGGNSAQFRDRMMTWSAKPVSRPDVAPVVMRSDAPDAQAPLISSRFGQRRHPLSGTPRFHSGIDIPGILGTSVRSAAPGRIAFAGWAGGYGNLVEIDHGAGLRTRYAHLARIIGAEGEEVAEGETIGLMGSTGRSTGSHLHFEIRRNGRAEDPLAFLAFPAASRRDVVEARAALVAIAEEPQHVSAYAKARNERVRQERTGA